MCIALFSGGITAKKWDQFRIEISVLSAFVCAITLTVYLFFPFSESTKTTKNTETLSDFRAVSWRCHPDSNWGIKVLQWAKALLSFARKSLFYGIFCDSCFAEDAGFPNWGLARAAFSRHNERPVFSKALFLLLKGSDSV